MSEFWRFIAVGIFNTFLGVTTLFAFYDYLGMGYWGASALSYFLCSIISYFLNKQFTFKNDSKISQTAWPFALNIAVCYSLAYWLAKPFVAWVLQSLSYAVELKVIERIALLTGMGLFTVLNYLGQKTFVFGK